MKHKIIYKGIPCPILDDNIVLDKTKKPYPGSLCLVVFKEQILILIYDCDDQWVLYGTEYKKWDYHKNCDIRIFSKDILSVLYNK